MMTATIRSHIRIASADTCREECEPGSYICDVLLQKNEINNI